MSAKALYARIVDQVTALGTRVYPHETPPTSAPVYPYAVYIGDGPELVMGAPGTSSESMTVAVLATTYSQALSVAKSVRDALHNQSGTWGTVTVVRAFYEAGSENVVRIADSDTWAVEQTFTVWSR